MKKERSFYMKLFDELKWRGLIKDVAGEDLEEQLNNKQITFLSLRHDFVIGTSLVRGRLSNH